MPEKYDRQFHIKVAEDLGSIKEGIKGIHERLDKINGKVGRNEERIDGLENWKSGITTKITLLSAGAGILFSFLFDWFKNLFKNN